MPWPTLFRRKKPTAAPSPKPSAVAAPAAVAQARTHARRRLIGAVLLLGMGVVLFPLLFETEPRPIPVDLPIIIPAKEGAPPLTMPASDPALAVSVASAPMPDAVALASPVATLAAAPVNVAASQPNSRGLSAASSPPLVATSPPASSPAPSPTTSQDLTAASNPLAAKPAPTPKLAQASTAGQEAQKAPAPAKATKPTPSAAATSREDKPPKSLRSEEKPAAPPTPRYVVQIGAFASESTVRDVRGKAQKAGLATFTQSVSLSSGQVTRVRVGPFEARTQAESAAERLRKAGLPATVVKL